MPASRSNTKAICERFATTTRDTAQALYELLDACPEDAALTFVFVSPAYDLELLGAGLAQLPGSVMACTSSGEIGPNGFQNGGITAMMLRSPAVWGATWTFDAASLDGLDALREEVEVLLVEHADAEVAGVLLIDGMSRQEERIAAAVYASLPSLPIIGASAGDDLQLRATWVFDGVRFVTGRVAFALLFTEAPLTTFRLQHHEPTGKRMVVTDALPLERLVREIDGLPAIEAYARAFGLAREDLVEAAEAAALFPLMVRVGKEHFLRSIQAFEPGGAIRFYCAIEPGTILTLGRPDRPVERLRAQLARVAADGQPLAALLLFDCVLRRLEAEHAGVAREVGALFAAAGGVGFSTYGEQYGPMHINQTLVGLAIGGGPL